MMTDEIPDFSEPKSDLIRFRIDNDVFEAFAQIPGGLLLDLGDMDAALADIDLKTKEVSAMLKASKAINESNKRYFRFLDMVLLPESKERFAQRLRSVDNPITMKQVMSVYRMLLGRYTGNPTQPPKPSSNGAGGIGDESTVSVPTTGLMPGISLLSDSSTSSTSTESETSTTKDS